MRSLMLVLLLHRMSNDPCRGLKATRIRLLEFSTAIIINLGDDCKSTVVRASTVVLFVVAVEVGLVLLTLVAHLIPFTV